MRSSEPTPHREVPIFPADQRKVMSYARQLGAVVVADLNGDGRPDLAIGADREQADEAGEHRLAVLLNRGDGLFGVPPQSAPLPGKADALAVADVDRDGHPDLIAATATGCDAGCGNCCAGSPNCGGCAL